MTPFRAWLAAIRPKTLALSVSPVLVGTALAFFEKGTFLPLPFFAALAAALLIQAGTNLHNDVADFRRGTDSGDRIGPPRATAEGWLSPEAVVHGAMAAFAAAFCLGIYLAWVGGWPIVAMGLASLAAGAAYSGGPRPLSSLPVGEFFVLLFFGLVAVAGSYYLQAGGVNGSVLLAGVVVGLPAAAVLTVNNYRDRDSDARAGRRTLSVLLPPAGSRLLYPFLMLSPFPLLILLLPRSWWLLPLLALLPALAAIRDMARLPVGPALNGVLARTAAVQFLLGLLLSAALVLARLL